MKIGFHVPIAKGFEHTYREATRLGCDVIQIFVKNPRSWAEKSWSSADREAFGRLFARSAGGCAPQLFAQHRTVR